ncbi:MAG: hypothetical protein V2I48_14940 [Xanthomonadales bacterium]|jgi:hypothetical protein|nr:hypothetical protein [Xanthomonadales bacterium]
MNRFLAAALLTLCSANSYATTQDINSTEYYVSEVECGLVVSTFAPSFDENMTKDELSEEAEKAVSFVFVDQLGCNDKKAIKRSSANKHSGGSTENNTDPTSQIQSDNPPYPNGLGWVLVDTFRNITDVNCVRVITDGWIYQRVNPSTLEVETTVMTEVTTIDILNCKGDPFPGPN